MEDLSQNESAYEAVFRLLPAAQESENTPARQKARNEIGEIMLPLIRKTARVFLRTQFVYDPALDPDELVSAGELAVSKTIATCPVKDFADANAVKRWMNAVMRKTFLSLERSHKRRANKMTDADIMKVSASHRNDIDIASKKQELIDALRTHLDQKQAEALIAELQNPDLASAEIAKQRGIGHKTHGVQIHRARRAIISNTALTRLIDDLLNRDGVTPHEFAAAYVVSRENPDTITR